MTLHDPRAARRRRRTGLAVLLIAIGSLLAITGAGPLGSSASARDNSNAGVVISSIDDYETYPAWADAPCPNQATLVGLGFQVDPDGSGPDPAGPAPAAPSLAALGDLPFGSTVIMTWDGWADGCEVVISLSVKRADQGTFNATTNQELLDFVACGADGAGCSVGGSYRLELTMPSFATGGCHYQVDAVLGPPLDVVGPAGSFYTNSLRTGPGQNDDGPDMLISANNGRAVCEPPTTATTPTTAATTTTTEATTTTTAVTTTTTEASTTTTSILATTLTTDPATSTTGAEVLGVSSTRPSATSLPRTGGGDGAGARSYLGIGLVLAGIGVALFGRERRLA